MKNSILKLAVFVFSLAVLNATAQKQPEKITVRGTQFYKGNKPYAYVGTNYWYGPMLGSKKIGDRKRLLRELDMMKKQGIDNLRVLVGAEGGTYDYTVTPALQTAQGVYDQDLLEGLDFFMAAISKRNMYAVLYLNNNWEWSGGYSQYLEWNSYGKIPNPNIAPNTWSQFMDYTKQYYACEPCVAAFQNHIKYILGRTNGITKTRYVNDHAIMAWQLANEPRLFTVENEALYTQWVNRSVDLIDSLDKNHLICTGSEGISSSNDDINTYERVHKNPKIDYLTMHIWPKNWGWFKVENENETTQTAIQRALEYMNKHIEVAKKFRRPIVIEEFGLPREKESLLASANVDNRNLLYTAFFEKLLSGQKTKGPLCGVNFWGFSGEGRGANAVGKWNKGDAFTTDPPQEPQGINSVYDTDVSTLALVKKYNSKLKK